MEFTEALGIRRIRCRDGESRLEVEIQPIHLARAARVHGGFRFTPRDTAMGRAVRSKRSEGRGCATVECRINDFGPVQEGRLVTVGRLVNPSRSIATAAGPVNDAAGKLVARASGTFFRTETRVQSERERR